MKLDPSAFVADPELIQELETRSSTICCERDRVLFHQGDEPAGLYILNKGLANLTTNASTDEEAATIQASAGSIFGMPGLIFNEPATLTVVARKGAEVSFVTRANFNDFVQTYPRLSLLHILATEARALNQAILRSKDAFAFATAVY